MRLNFAAPAQTAHSLKTAKRAEKSSTFMIKPVINSSDQYNTVLTTGKNFTKIELPLNELISAYYATIKFKI